MNQTKSTDLRKRLRIWRFDQRLRWDLLRDRFHSDRRGGTAVQAILVLPIFLVVMVTLIILWEVVLVRRSLHVGTYEATRFLSLYPTYTPERTVWNDIAKRMVANELNNNPFLDRQDMLGNRLNVTVDIQDIECKARFTVDVVYQYQIPTVDPFPGPFLNLQESIEGEILCN